MADRLEEAIRVVLETEGREGLDALRDALSGLGDASAETVGDAARLVDTLTQLNETTAKATRFSAMRDELVQLQEQFDQNQRASLQLALQLGATEKPSRELLRAQKDLRDEGERLQTALGRQFAALNKSSTELQALGVDTNDMVAAQQRLRSQVGSTTAALADQAKVVRQQADANRALKDRLEEGDRQFRGQAEASRNAAASLEAYRQRAARAATETHELNSAGNAAEGVFTRLRGVMAAALGFFSFGSIVAGIKSIVTEGSDAEQELAQLEAALASTGRQAEFTADQLKAMADATDAGLFSGGDITKAQTRLLTYTNVLGEQFPAALQVAIDQAQRLGISTEQSAEIVGRALQTPSKAMEALSRQGFVLEESQKQLIAQLEATGRTAEAQSIILDMLVESYGGAAAAAKVGTIAGLWNQARESLKDFQELIANSGVLDYFKAQLNGLIDTTQRLAADGTLNRWAKQTADAIIAAAGAIKGATTFIYEHVGALTFMAKAYAAFKIGQAAVQLNTWRVQLIASTQAQIANAAAMDAAGKGALRLGNILKTIPTSLLITVGLVGLEVAIRGVKEMAEALGEELGKNSEATKQAGEASRALRERLYEEVVARRAVAVSFNEYKDAAVQTSEQVARMSEAERASYQLRLDGLKEYLDAQLGYLLRQKELGLATQEELAQLAAMPSRLAAVKAGYQAISDGVGIAQRAMETGITPAAQAIIDKLEGIDGSAKLAKTSIQQLFDGLNFQDSNTLGNVGVALASIADAGAAADKNVRDGLLATLQKLSGEELLRFQTAAQAAFAEIPAGATATAAVLDTTLLTALERLGVSAERMGVKFTEAGRDATAAFTAIVENANATGNQIETAFTAALGKVATLDEAKQLGAILRSAGEQGKIGFDQAERAGAALQARIQQITVAMDPLSDEFGRLGIQSQASLNAARDAAKAAFQAIVKGAGEGKASIEDVRRALAAYGNAAKAAVADSDSSAKARVDSELDVLNAIYDVNGALDQMGTTGQAAGGQVADGANTATQGLQQVSNAAAAAAAATGALGAASDATGAQMNQVTSSAQGMSFALGQISDAAHDALANLGEGNQLRRFAEVFNGIVHQKRELREYNAELQRQIQNTDGLAREQAKLGKRFNYIAESDLAETVQLQQQLTQAKQARAEETERANAEIRAANEKRLADQKAAEQAEQAAGEAMANSDQTLTIDWKAPSKDVTASASAADLAAAERMAALVAPMVLRRIERARGISIRARRN